MRAFVRLEAMCADVVERAFATAFPSAIEPVQIARKLVAAFESGATPAARAGRRFVVRLSTADYARFEANRAYLERQWTAMLVRLAERSGRPQRPPAVTTACDASIATGTVAIAVEALAPPARLALAVRRGVPERAPRPLVETLVVGRDPACDVTLVDPRVSRRHVEIRIDAGTPVFRDLGSSNGTRHNGTLASGGELGLGDVLTVGDSELVVVGADDR